MKALAKQKLMVSISFSLSRGMLYACSWRILKTAFITYQPNRVTFSNLGGGGVTLKGGMGNFFG